MSIHAVSESTSTTTRSRCWVEVDLERIVENVMAIRLMVGADRKVIAVVKANAYGHGIKRVAQTLAETGIRHFAVATLDEAIELRQILAQQEILVLEGFQPQDERLFELHQLTASFSGSSVVPASIPLHLKIDTGMTRLGIPWEQSDRIQELVARLGKQLTGVYSHFCCADDDREFTMTQLERFSAATKGLTIFKHLSSSHALPVVGSHFDAVRPGFALYGLGPDKIGLQPAMKWKARLLSAKQVPAGTPIGYGRSFVTSRQTRVGVVAVGYADGYSRAFSNVGSMEVRGVIAPVVGRVSMDLTTLDLTACPHAAVGDEVLVMDDSAKSLISAEGLAQAAGTIPYEIITSIGPRVRRVYTGFGETTIGQSST